jgi:carboxypeptidase Q
MPTPFFESLPHWLGLTLLTLTCASSSFAQTNRASPTATPQRPAVADSISTSLAAGTATNDPIARIRDEGLNHSQAMQILEYLTEVIGPRLTGSPSLKRANEWTRDKLKSWCLANSHLEAWGPFGRGWSLKRFSAAIVDPQYIPLNGYPNAWTPGFEYPLVADVVYLDVKTNTDLEAYKGKLKGAIVLISPPRELKTQFEPLATRLSETNLLSLANAGPPAPEAGDFGASPSPRTNRSDRARSSRPAPRVSTDPAGPSDTNATRQASRPPTPSAAGYRGPQSRFLSFCAREGAALIVHASSLGEGGSVFVAAASVPRPGTNTVEPEPFSRTNSIRAWATNAPAIPPQITLAAEDYNRLVRLARAGQQLKMAVDLQVQFFDQDVMAYNTVAEIPGSDLKDQIVMLGAHLDSWHAGTGATDNGAGVAAAMEALRIIKSLNLQPRRTIRLGLWSGEEQGLLGSRAYVSNHFGYYAAQSGTTGLRAPKDNTSTKADGGATDAPPERKLVRQKEYARLSVYFNLDNGAGKIRGVHLQGNEAVRPLFRGWLEPLADLGAQTLSLRNTGGTDHIPFDAVGLPGFQFIQDPLDYGTLTHHGSQDVYDRVLPDDLKQAAVILAAFAYDAAMLDKKLPRKRP